jgi:putative Mg2+ transporter-C (MgtC) family protein
MDVPDLNVLRDLLIAYVIALPIALDRERATRSAGLRTFPIVAMASCGFFLVARAVLGDAPEPLSRVMYGVIAAVGFLGGGMIVRERNATHGTSTAASILATGAVGMAVAFQHYGIALSLAAVNFLSMLVFKPVKAALRGKRRPPHSEA